jgi:hypothetical protein
MDINIYPIRKNFETLLELYPPMLANRYLPDWYKKMGNKSYFDIVNTEDKIIDAKSCPAIQDMLIDGIILPSWSDIYIYMDNEGIINWEVKVGLADGFNDFEWIGKQNSKQLGDMPREYHNDYPVFKLHSPYYFDCPEGYGIEYYDLFYHSQRPIQFLPGKVMYNIWHETNFPFFFLKDLHTIEGKKILIKAGEPLLGMRLYKLDTKTNLKINNYNQDFIEKQNKNTVLHSSLSQNWTKYKNNVI